MTIPSPHGGFVGENMVETARAVFMDRECSVIWPAMARRMSEYAEQWEEKQIGLPEGVRYGSKSPVEFLLFTIQAARHGAAPHERTPTSERKERGGRIARLACELRRELAACKIEEWGLPNEFHKAIRDTAVTVADEFIDDEKEWAESHGLPSSQATAREKNGAYRAIQFAIVQQDSRGLQFPALAAIENGAKAWAASEATLYRPSDPNADRLYFIRAMTDFFRENYNTPLREATAALTRCLFACEINASVVAKLAP
jgi:hypothetical protein